MACGSNSKQPASQQRCGIFYFIFGESQPQSVGFRYSVASVRFTREDHDARRDVQNFGHDAVFGVVVDQNITRPTPASLGGGCLVYCGAGIEGTCAGREIVAQLPPICPLTVRGVGDSVCFSSLGFCAKFESYPIPSSFNMLWHEMKKSGESRKNYGVGKFMWCCRKI